MNLKAETTIPQFNDALATFIREERLSLPQGLRYQGRLLGQRIIDFTPPHTLAEGRAAVARDIRRAVMPLRQKDFNSREIKKLIRDRNYNALEIIFARFSDGQLKGAAVKPFSSELHQSVRDRRGRVTKFKRVSSPDVDEIKSYIESQQKHVGQAKGGWSKLVTELGGSEPDWISRHKEAGVFEDHADDLVNGYIRAENRSEWAKAGDEDRIVENAIRSRTKDIITYIQKRQAEALAKANL